MRWHPIIIRQCLSIFHVSLTAYKQIASKHNKLLTLPFIDHLKKYINYTTPKCGFNPDVIKKFVINSNLHKFEPFQKNVSLYFGEMKLQQGLLYKRSSGKLVEFSDIREINQEIESFQARCVGKENKCFDNIKKPFKICKCTHGSRNLHKFRMYNWLLCFSLFYVVYITLRAFCLNVKFI